MNEEERLNVLNTLLWALDMGEDEVASWWGSFALEPQQEEAYENIEKVRQVVLDTFGPLPELEPVKEQ